MNSEDELYHPMELAKRMRVKQQTVTRWIREGRIHAVRAGRHWRIPKEEFERAIREGVRTDDKK